MSKTSNTIALIDADILLYQTLFGIEKEIEFSPDCWVLYTELNEAKIAVKDKLAKIVDQCGAIGFALCLTGPTNFRTKLSPEYKGNRTQRKPMGFKPFREWFSNEYSIIALPHLEADDVLGILATKLDPSPYIIVSQDKDLMQIPGKHLVDGRIIHVTPEEGQHLHMMQTLTGDPVDNYKGCPGIGKAKAEKILAKAYETGANVWEAVTDAYAMAGLTVEDALLQARLAKILQSEDWDEGKQEVKLWTP